MKSKIFLTITLTSIFLLGIFCQPVYSQFGINNSKELTLKADSLFDLKDYKNALKWYQLILANQHQFNSEPDTAYANLCFSIAETHMNLGNYDSALNYLKKDLDIEIKVRGDQHPYVATVYNDFGVCYFNLHENEKAISFLEKCLALRIMILDKSNPDIYQAYLNLAELYESINNPMLAIKNYKSAAEVEFELSMKETSITAKLYNSIGLIYFKNLGEYKTAIEYFQKTLKIRINIFGEQNVDVATVYNNLGTSFSRLALYDEAFNYLNKSLDIRQKILIETDPDLAESFNSIGYLFFKTGANEKAIFYWEKALKINKLNYGAESKMIVTQLTNLSLAYLYNSDFQKAIEYSEKALAIKISNYGYYNSSTAISFNNLGLCYSSIGDYEKAIENYQKALEIKLKIVGDDHPDLGITYNNLASRYFAMGDYKKSIDFFEKALDIQTKYFGEDHPDLSLTYNNLSATYLEYGDFKKALEFCNKALAIDIKLNGLNHPDVALSCLNVGEIYNTMGFDSLAIKYYFKSLSILKENYGEKNSTVALILNRIGSVYQNMVNYKIALNYYKKSLKIQKHLYSGKNFKNGLPFQQIGLFNYYQGKYIRANFFYEKALSAYSTNLIDYTNIYLKENFMSNYILLHDNVKFQKIFYEITTSALKEMNHLKTFLNEKELEHYLNRNNYLNTLTSALLSFPSCEITPTDALLSVSIFTKGILWNQSQKFKAAVYASTDSATKENYWQLQVLQKNINQQYEKVNTVNLNHESYLDSLIQLSNDLQFKLFRNLSLTLDTTSADWQDIQKKIKAEDAIVEIIRSNKILMDKKGKPFKIDSLQYVALIVTKETPEYPEMVVLPKGVEMEGLWFQNYLSHTSGTNKLQNDNASYQAYWKPIAEKLQGKKHIYFCADGIYNKINLNVLFNPADSSYLADEKDIQLVTNIKEVLKLKQDTAQKFISKNMNAVVIGNPKFNLSASDTLLFANNTRSLYDDDVSVSALDTIMRGLNISQLPGTEKEVNFISSTLKNYGWNVSTYTGNSATEEVIKSLRSPNILHIATHGYFLEDNSSNNNKSGWQFINPTVSTNDVIVKRAFLGVGLADINSDSIKAKGIKNSKGVYITMVLQQGAGEEAGLKIGDIVTKINNTEVNTVPSFQNEVSNYKAGDKIKVTYFRNGVEKIAKVVLKQREERITMDKGRSDPFLKLGEKYDNPLLRSGLLFSGAQNTFNGNESDNRDNGVLTSQEAMSLFLDSTDLVVLSACETAGGDVKNGEGVYGLQRAFRVAGAHSILMSMWKVDDEATKELMTGFYKNWIEDGMNKYDAFKIAQLQLRKIPKYNHPYYWGAFVMVGE